VADPRGHLVGSHPRESLRTFTWRTRRGDGGSGVRRLTHLSVTGQVSTVSVLQPQAMLLGMLGENTVK